MPSLAVDFPGKEQIFHKSRSQACRFDLGLRRRTLWAGRYGDGPRSIFAVEVKAAAEPV